MLVLLACGETPTQPPLGSPLFAISDGAHQGNTHFFFLPPLVPQPEFSGDFDATLAPVVEVCVVVADDCGEIIESFPEVPVTDQHYQVDWHTQASGLQDGTAYRIAVRLGATELGFIDVVARQKVSGTKQGTDPFPLKIGRTLPIKFRVEQGEIGPVRQVQVGSFITDRDGKGGDNVLVQRTLGFRNPGFGQDLPQGHISPCSVDIGVGCDLLVSGEDMGLVEFGPSSSGWDALVARLLDDQDDLLGSFGWSWSTSGDCSPRCSSGGPTGPFLGGSGRTALESEFFGALLSTGGVEFIDRILLEPFDRTRWTVFGRCFEGVSEDDCGVPPCPDLGFTVNCTSIPASTASRGNRSVVPS